MGKRYFCDICGKEVWFLYDLCTKEKGIIELCQECYYDRREFEDSLISLHSRKRLWKILGGAES